MRVGHVIIIIHPQVSRWELPPDLPKQGEVPVFTILTNNSYESALVIFFDTLLFFLKFYLLYTLAQYRCGPETNTYTFNVESRNIFRFVTTFAGCSQA